MKIRKQVYELTLDDLNNYPAWEFALDEEGEDDQDEATVRPILSFKSIDPKMECRLLKQFSSIQMER